MLVSGGFWSERERRGRTQLAIVILLCSRDGLYGFSIPASTSWSAMTVAVSLALSLVESRPETKAGSEPGAVLSISMTVMATTRNCNATLKFKSDDQSQTPRKKDEKDGHPDLFTSRLLHADQGR